MNPIGAALDILLLALLGWALVIGLKLNGRLKTLREGQEGFAKAVAELDVASRRAEAGLAEMRRAAEQTHDALQARIETARALIARLEAASEDAAARIPAAPPARRAGPSGATSTSRAQADSAPVAGERPSPVSREPSLQVRAPDAAGKGVFADLIAPEPVGFAEMIRRTLREPR